MRDEKEKQKPESCVHLYTGLLVCLDTSRGVLPPPFMCTELYNEVRVTPTTFTSPPAPTNEGKVWRFLFVLACIKK